MTGTNQLEIKTFYDENTFTLTYIVYDPRSKDAVVIDPVLDFDQFSGRISHESADKIVEFVRDESLKVHYILETHAHADHLSGAHFLRENHFSGAKIGVGKNIVQVQKRFKGIFNLPTDFKTDGSQFDELFEENHPVSVGSFEFKALFTPGHTPACVSYHFPKQKLLFTGDTIFMPDYGTGRCDFPDGSARDLYHSISNKIFKLPEDTAIFVGHDYLPGGRDLAFESSVGEQKKLNIHIKAETSEADFVKVREGRDAGLNAPLLLFPSVQLNIAAGELPRPESNGTVYFKTPLTLPEEKV